VVPTIGTGTTTMCGSVTEDIARAVWSKARSEYRPIGKSAQEFLERTLGADVTVVE